MHLFSESTKSSTDLLCWRIVSYRFVFPREREMSFAMTGVRRVWSTNLSNLNIKIRREREKYRAIGDIVEMDNNRRGDEREGRGRRIKKEIRLTVQNNKKPRNLHEDKRGCKNVRIFLFPDLRRILVNSNGNKQTNKTNKRERGHFLRR